MADFPVIIADVSTISALSFGVQGYWHISVDDITTVSALEIEIERHFPIVIDDTTVVMLGVEVRRDFPIAIADTTAVVLSFEGWRFPVMIGDKSSISALGIEIGQHFSIAVDDTTTVSALRFWIDAGRFPVLVDDTTRVTIGFQNWYAGMPLKSLLWVGTSGWAAVPPGTTFLYNVSRPLMSPGQVVKFRAWKYDASLPYNPGNEINIGTAMYDTMLLAQEACQNDWDMLSPSLPATPPTNGGTARWQSRTR